MDSGDGLREETLPANRRLTWEGCSVLLDINDGDRLVFAMLTHGATLKTGKKRFPLAPLIGCPFGSLFKVENSPNGSHLARCFPSSAPEAATTEQVKDHCQASVEFKDNRSLVDNNTAQGLSSEDIDAMRREGATGAEIVEALIANSSTFDKKTTFSQQKYKVKKQKKYAPKVLLRRPFSRSICEAYFKKSPTRIGSLRVDALSLLLSMANVGAYSDVLVLDTVGGLLTGAVAERLGGTGYVCCTYFGSSNLPIDIVRMFNFSSEVNSRIVQAPFTDLIGQDNDEPSQPDNPKPHAANTNTLLSAESILPKSLAPVLHDESLEEVNVSNAKFSYSKEISNELNSMQTSPHAHSCSFNEDVGNAQPCSISEKLIPPGRKASTEVIKTWKRKGFTSLIVATPEMEVDSLVQKLLPLISYSGPFAVYHHCLQPLAMCMHNLQTSKMAISLQISEPWLREYQVLPSRTHPHMQTSGFGGYILSGIRICGGSSS